MSFTYITNKSLDNTKNLIFDIQNNNIISLDTETDGLDELTCNLLLLQLKINDNIYVINYKSAGKEFVDYIIQLIKDGNKLVIGHNLKYDLKIIYRHTNEMLENVYDTMLGEVLIFKGVGDNFYSLAYLVNKYSNVNLNKEVRKQFENHNGNFTQEELIYSATDVQYLEDIMNKQIKQIEEQRQMKILQLEMRVLPVVVSMELEGALIDKKHWKHLEDLASKETLKLEADLKSDLLSHLDFSQYKNALELVDKLHIPAKTKKLRSQLESITDISSVRNWIEENINVGSSKQLKTILNLIGIPVESTEEKVLNKFSEHEVIEKILDYREQAKKVSTYGESFLEQIHPATGRIHAEFHQLGADTGRFSATKKLHQIPKDKDDTTFEESYRTGFIAPDGYYVIKADYSQMELRVLGAISGEKEFINSYKNGEDLHKVTASKLFNVDLKDVTKDQRKKGKTMNFGVVYGIGSWGLWRNFKIPQEDGEKYLKNFFDGYPTLDRFIKGAGKKIYEIGYSITPMGRRRYFDKKTLYADYKEKAREEARIKREGVNHIIQGGSADIVKIAMCDIYYKNPFGRDKLKIFLQVHDEIVCYAHESIKEKAVEFIREMMLNAEQPFLGDIPAEVDIHTEKFWSKD